MRILVTGTAGFIGSAVAIKLLERGDEVVGLDNMNDYYDVNLKKARLARFKDNPSYHHVHADLADRRAIEGLFEEFRPTRVVHLAAQAGVRYAAKNPHIYLSSNVTGFLHILEGCRNTRVEHLVFASTSSVYGANRKLPFSEHDPTAHPLTLYAATKKANELMAHSYAHLYGLPCTGLRFFTVYGPWGRPDMALFLFTKAILANEPISLFNHGNHRRSFTYIDDIVEGVVRVTDKVATPTDNWDAAEADPATSLAPYRLFNLGSPRTVDLLRYIEVLEDCLSIKARLEMLPLQAGDVPETQADTAEIAEYVRYVPEIPIETGIARFVSWYRDYYQV
ncbi:MAG TPA: NAD-dependent epimerase [Gemmatimonadaceae bacterium]|nr:NAD-dependent epimerase [Gemmatimonadaceae bacterium]